MERKRSLDMPYKVLLIPLIANVILIPLNIRCTDCINKPEL